jgi:hypothetical protein
MSSIQEKLKSLWGQELALPSNDKPVVINKAKFYLDYFEHRGTRHNYMDVSVIMNRKKVQYINGLLVKEEVIFQMYIEGHRSIDLSDLCWFYILGRRSYRQTSLIAGWVQRTTFENRLLMTLNIVKREGSYKYNRDVTISRSGDIYYKDEFIANLIDAINDGNSLSYGERYYSLFGTDRGQNPGVFKVKRQHGRNSPFGSKYISFHVTYNKDVFDAILVRLFEDGAIV